ncbi:D-glycerate dehydrogenase [Paenibacillus oenotherae]|uniref:D-glycerate dehydrogenase n=1 Tax=Paenibacillus oenotherae TaxID=1435645 RepID=A0ABS7D8X1_9BACL|nr:D-glycerate dehydrogenase [Paenibacillus oenotherae]MBW7476390.1 D-glycerate dehydrogenase [Paenibacillus oenotherae]
MSEKPKVYITEQIWAEAVDWLQQYCDCTVWAGEGKAPREHLLQVLGNYDGLITTGSAVTIDEALLAAAPRLKLVSTISVGYNHFDLEAMRKAHVIGTHTPYVLDETVADLVMGLMLSVARRMPELDRLVKSGGWNSAAGEELFGIDVHHSTLGIIGMGRIGEAIARRAVDGFGMKLAYYNRSRRPELEERYGADYMQVEELLRQSDYVVLMIPLSDETKHFIRAEHFAMMKGSAIFINASRGATVDEEALIEALRSGQIRGAGLDVYEREPIARNNPLLGMSNVVALPHIGSATHRTRQDMMMLAARNAAAVLTGQGEAYIVKELQP